MSCSAFNTCLVEPWERQDLETFHPWTLSHVLRPSGGDGRSGVEDLADSSGENTEQMRRKSNPAFVPFASEMKPCCIRFLPELQNPVITLGPLNLQHFKDEVRLQTPVDALRCTGDESLCS